MQAVHQRAQQLLVFFIDGATPIDQAEPEWDIYLAVQEAEDGTSLLVSLARSEISKETNRKQPIATANPMSKVSRQQHAECMALSQAKNCRELFPPSIILVDPNKTQDLVDFPQISYSSPDPNIVFERLITFAFL